MQPSLVRPAVAAAMSTASALGLAADDAAVLWVSNRIAVRLLPCDVLARVAIATPASRAGAEFEIEVARRLAETDAPVAGLDPRVEPRAYARDGFVVTLWRYYEPTASQDVAPGAYARALERLHAGLREIALDAPRFTDRVAEARRLVAEAEATPDLGDADRALLVGALDGMVAAIAARGAAEQLLHGEPHPGNLLGTRDGLLFIDLETCCRGPVEFDVVHAPAAVGERYRGADPELLRACRILSVAMVAAWRWDRTDRFPDGRRMGIALTAEVRAGLEHLGPGSGRRA